MENEIMKDLIKAIILSLLVIALLGIITKLMFVEASGGKSIFPFIAYDINKDNYISQSEFYYTNTKRTPEDGREGMPLMHIPEGPDFREYDTDLNGKLDEMEFLHSCKSCHSDR